MFSTMAKPLLATVSLKLEEVTMISAAEWYPPPSGAAMRELWWGMISSEGQSRATCAVGVIRGQAVRAPKWAESFGRGVRPSQFEPQSRSWPVQG